MLGCVRYLSFCTPLIIFSENLANAAKYFFVDQQQHDVNLNGQVCCRLVELVMRREALGRGVLVDSAVELVKASAVKTLPFRSVVECEVAGCLGKIEEPILIIASLVKKILTVMFYDVGTIAVLGLPFNIHRLIVWQVSLIQAR